MAFQNCEIKFVYYLSLSQEKVGGKKYFKRKKKMFKVHLQKRGKGPGFSETSSFNKKSGRCLTSEKPSQLPSPPVFRWGDINASPSAHPQVLQPQMPTRNVRQRDRAHRKCSSFCSSESSTRPSECVISLFCEGTECFPP